MFEKHSEIPGQEAVEKGTTWLLLLLIAVVLIEIMKFSKVFFRKPVTAIASVFFVPRVFWQNKRKMEKKIKMLFPQFFSYPLKERVSHSVVSNSLWSHGLEHSRLLCPWILRASMLEWVAICPGDFSDPGTEPGSPTFQADSLPTEPPEKKWIKFWGSSTWTLCKVLTYFQGKLKYKY